MVCENSQFGAMGVRLLGRFANPSRWNRSLGAALQCSQELVGRPVSSSHFAPGLVLRPALHWVLNANGCFSLSKMEGSRVAVLGFCTCGLIGVMDWAQRVYVCCAEFGCLSFSDNFLSPPLGMSGVQTLIILGLGIIWSWRVEHYPKVVWGTWL